MTRAHDRKRIPPRVSSARLTPSDPATTSMLLETGVRAEGAHARASVWRRNGGLAGMDIAVGDGAQGLHSGTHVESAISTRGLRHFGVDILGQPRSLPLPSHLTIATALSDPVHEARVLAACVAAACRRRKPTTTPVGHWCRQPAYPIEAVSTSSLIIIFYVAVPGNARKRMPGGLSNWGVPTAPVVRRTYIPRPGQTASNGYVWHREATTESTICASALRPTYTAVGYSSILGHGDAKSTEMSPCLSKPTRHRSTSRDVSPKIFNARHGLPPTPPVASAVTLELHGVHPGDQIVNT
ncbi:hypothetical protein JB92DRAFT_2838371 [Gautieria morchelliformis]|nr:hypothetical protein JB92DRAFT_2838371 [Gautieria morchelliformis]